jgi:hypothetical protein
MVATRSEMLEELLGLECRCGNTKRSGMSFCRRCFLLLPRKLKHDLYKLMGNGYEGAYRDSVACLIKETT